MHQIQLKLSIILVFISSIFFSCKEKSSLPDPLAAGWNNQSVCELVEENEKIRILKCTFAPEIGHEKHYHKPYFGYTLSGSKFRIKDKNGTDEIQVKTGSYFYNEGTEGHEVLNIGDSTAVFLIIEPK